MNHTRTSDKTIDLSVEKVWKGDKAADRPDRVLVQLYRDGKAYGGSTALNERNGWSYAWDNLSDKYEWTVDEIAVPAGYSKKVTADGFEFTITNTKNDDVIIPEPEQPTEPGEPLVPGGPADPDDDTGILDGQTPGHGLDSSPNTGDNFPTYLWLLLVLAGFAGTACAWRAAKAKSRHD
ncbi:MAG: Cna B-type domain-containing protein [Clostridia bacterium]|nr:Cna B-type domain-containing protein [Clostridia bacterium]